MKQIPLAILAVLTLSLSAMYFTSKKPNVEAMTEKESTMMFTIFRRLQNAEKQGKFKVPEELKLYINCKEEDMAKSLCRAE